MEYKVDDVIKENLICMAYRYHIVEVLGKNKYRAICLNSLVGTTDTIITISNDKDFYKIGEMFTGHIQRKCRYCGFIENENSTKFLKLDNGTIECTHSPHYHEAEDHYGVMEDIAIIIGKQEE